MSTEKENSGGSFLDLFDVDHSKFSTEEIKQPVEEIVKTEDDTIDKVAEIGDKDSIEESTKEEAEEVEIEEEVEKETSAEEDTNNISDLVNELVSSDILLFDEEKEYDSSPSGLKELIQETVEKRSKEFVESYKSGLGEKATNLLDVLSKGGSVEDFIAMEQEVDFSKVPTVDDKGNPLEGNQMYLVQDWMEVQGYSKEEIEETLEDYKAGGLLQKQADIAKRKLASWQTEKNAKLIESKAAEIAKQKEEAIIEAKNFEKEVTSLTEIAGFSLTKEKAKKLHEFITKPVKDGKTQFQLKDSPENRMLYAFMAMEGFDKEKLVKEVATKQAIKLKKDLSNFKDKEASPKRAPDRVKYDKTKNIVSEIKWMGL